MPLPSTTSWNRARSNRSPSCRLGIAAESFELEPADHVAGGLAGHGDVAIDLRFGVAAHERRRTDEELDRLVPRPSERVQSGVDHESCGAQ